MRALKHYILEISLTPKLELCYMMEVLCKLSKQQPPTAGTDLSQASPAVARNRSRAIYKTFLLRTDVSLEPPAFLLPFSRMQGRYLYLSCFLLQESFVIWEGWEALGRFRCTLDQPQAYEEPWKNQNILLQFTKALLITPPLILKIFICDVLPGRQVLRTYFRFVLLQREGSFPPFLAKLAAPEMQL